MCGDAPGDEKAANENGVLFYPILVRSEEASWEALPAFLGLVKEGNAEGEADRLKAAFFPQSRRKLMRRGKEIQKFVIIP